MISAPTGESQNVTGRISAMVVSGPIPGRTPIAVPITQPKKHKTTFCQVSATPNPMIMLDAISLISKRRRPQRNRNSQSHHEDRDIDGNEQRAQQSQGNRADVSIGESRKDGRERKREHEPKRIKQKRKRKTRQRDEDERAPFAALESLACSHD